MMHKFMGLEVKIALKISAIIMKDKGLETCVFMYLSLMGIVPNRLFIVFFILAIILSASLKLQINISRPVKLTLIRTNCILTVLLIEY